MAKAVYIVSAVRTPIGKFGGLLVDFTQPDLGTIAVRAARGRRASSRTSHSLQASSYRRIAGMGKAERRGASTV